MFLRNLYRRFVPERLKRSLDPFRGLRASRPEGLNEKKVLILSPHPDDDIISCGGTLQLYKSRGAEVTAVYMTDGRKGGRKTTGDELVAIRKEEARRAAGIVGIDRLIFLQNRDGELAPTYKTVTELSDILYEIRPEAVFLPFFIDNHADHMAASRIFLLASRARSAPAAMCYSYGIWTPLPAFNLLVDITTVSAQKDRALAEHRSQLEMLDLSGAAFGLSRYYSLMSGGNGLAEAFLACRMAEFRRLGKLWDRKPPSFFKISL